MTARLKTRNEWLVQRIARSAILAAFLVPLAASCSESHETHFTPEDDAKTIADLGGLWVSAERANLFVDASLDPFDSGEAAPLVALRVCRDSVASSYCSQDECAKSGSPCHEVGSERSETLQWDSVEMACDCLNCECVEYLAGFPIRGVIRVDDQDLPFTGRAKATNGGEWSLSLDIGAPPSVSAVADFGGNQLQIDREHVTDYRSGTTSTVDASVADAGSDAERAIKALRTVRLDKVRQASEVCP